MTIVNIHMTSGTRKSVSIRSTKKYYPSNMMNQIIVNAITGVKYPYCVGSKESTRLYKVTDTTGAYSLGGTKKYTNDLKEGQEKTPNNYYFDNPSEYMQDRGFHRHAESCDEWSKYQKSLIGHDGGVNIAVFHNKKQKRLHIPMKFDSKVTVSHRS
jgi:hypothetical protein